MAHPQSKVDRGRTRHRTFWARLKSQSCVGVVADVLGSCDNPCHASGEACQLAGPRPSRSNSLLVSSMSAIELI